VNNVKAQSKRNSIFLDRDTRWLSPKERELRARTAKWVEDAFAASDATIFGVTVTCFQALRNDRGGFTKLTREELSKQLVKLFKRLDKKILGTVAVRHGDRLRRLTAIEGGGCSGKRMHAHFLLEVPTGRAAGLDVQSIVEHAWLKCRWALGDVFAKPCLSVGAAASYFGKTGSDAMDWENTVLEQNNQTGARISPIMVSLDDQHK